MTDLRKDRDSILSALREYVDLGLPIIPLCSHDHVGYSEKHISTCQQAGKIPIIKGWREHEETTLEQVQSWVKQFHNINIGLPLGNVSGYVGIDIDGDLGEDMLEEMSGGDLPDTWEYITGAGRRLLYSIPVGMQTKKYVNMHKDGGHEECSILCDGQQTVLPPSIHHTGRIYAWREGHSTADIDCAMAPEWLLDLVKADSHRISGSGTMDLTKPPNSSDAQEDAVTTAYIQPILVSEAVLSSEFIGYGDLEIDTVPPDTDYIGTDAKEQKKEEVIGEKELMQTISSGNRDNQMTKIIGSFCARFRSLGKDYIMLMAKNHNQQFCDPPLDEYAIEAKVNHFWEMEQMKSAQFKSKGVTGEDKKRFAPGLVAQATLNAMESQGYCLKVDKDHPIVWVTKKSEGPWKPLDTRSGAFQVHLRDPLSDPEMGGDPTWSTVRHYKDAANAVVVELRSAGRFWSASLSNTDTQTLDSYKYIPLSGGKLLDWRTGELHAWDPDTDLTYVLPVEYDPEAKAPHWDQRMKEWLPDEGSRKIIQEFIGYALIPYMGFEKALVIQGEGANGKSLLLEAVQGLLGYKVVDSINMRNLFSRFGQADLVGKILNIVNEAGSDYLRGGAADDFKNLVSGGRVKADVKNLAPITFNNTAKFIFSSNHDVKTGDKSEGWLRRLIIVPFEEDFRNSSVPKHEIMRELRQEYSGIFNWALEGLRRLMDQQCFSTSVSAQRKKASYVRDNDVAADFFMQCLETFDLTSMSVDGKPVRCGTPSSLINYLFGAWIDYRESTVQKRTENITKYLEKKHALSKARTTHTLHVKKVMTECWIGLRLNIRDTGFLETLIQEPFHKFPEVKEYAVKKLQEIDEAIAAEEGYAGQANSQVAATIVREFPDMQAN